MIERLWPDSTIVCIASGPSLTPDDVLAVRGRARILAVNDGLIAAPWADALFAADEKWWKWHAADRAVFPAHCFTVSISAALDYHLQYVHGSIEFGLSDNAWQIAHGGHSGYGAVNVAYHLGARRIVLLGYDMQPGPRGQQHFFGDHPDGSHLAYESRLRGWPVLYSALRARNVELLNATRQTAITCVPQIPLSEVFHAPA